MKKLTITIALMLVVALAMPAFGASFSDVPASHWSYNAINKLVAAGIVEGYPDGEYKGDKSMTRYEMAVMVSRALDNIVDEMNAMGQGLTTGQAEDVTAIVKSLMEKNTNESLSDAQAEEVADIVDALTFELRAELKVLGADLDALGKDVDELAAKVDAMDVPEDNIEFGMDVDTFFEAADYDKDASEVDVAMLIWADGDVLDLDLPTYDGVDGVDVILNGGHEQLINNPSTELKGLLNDRIANDVYGDDYSNITGPEQTIIDKYVNALDSDDVDSEDADDLPAEKRFWQEYSFNINGNLGEADFNLNVDTLRNVFTEERSAFNYDEEDKVAFEMDTALLELKYKDFAFQMGDLEDYGVARYFIDEEDLEGVETKVNYLDTDWTFLMAGYGENSETDVYGVTAEKEMDYANLTGRLYQVRKFAMGYGLDDSGKIVNNKLINDEITVAAAEMSNFSVTDAFTIGGELVYTDVNDAGMDDFLFAINGEFVATDALTINGMVETVGDEVVAFQNDLEADNDYDLFEIGAEYVINDMNTVDGTITYVDPGKNYGSSREEKYVYAANWNNVYGDYTNKIGVELTQNDDFEDNHDVRVIELGTEYVWNESTTLGAKLVNKNEDVYNGDSDLELSYNYLEATMDKDLAENVSWNVTGRLIDGDLDIDKADDISTKSNMIETSLSVSF